MSNCSETELHQIALDLAQNLKRGDLVLLEGPMGVGKTTFARALLSGLGVTQPPEGSPTFAIVHEYDSPLGGVAHMDYYRLRAEEEIEDAGIPSYYWERKLIVISEWLSMWPEFEKAVLESDSKTRTASGAENRQIWKVKLDFGTDEESKRNILILLNRKAGEF